MTDPFATACDTIFAGDCARDATIQRGTDQPVALRVVVDDGVAKVGQYGQVIGRVSKVSFLRAEWPPARGDILTIDGQARKIEAIDSDDGYIVEAVLHG
jgi:hypothetical protein